MFMNSESSITSDPHRLLHNFSDKISLKRSDKYVVVSNINIYYTFTFNIYFTIRRSHKNDKIKISAPVWNEEFEYPDGSYSVSSIQGYFQYMWKSMDKY